MIVSDTQVQAIRDLQESVYNTSAEKGFHERDVIDEIALADEINRDLDVAEAVSSHEKHYAELMNSNRILLAVGELLEAHDEIRSGHSPTEIYHKGGKPEGVPIELADAVIRIFDYAESRDIDLAGAIQEKAEFNASRPYRHGRKF